MKKSIRWVLTLSVVALAGLSSRTADAQKKTFTSNADFDGGDENNVCHGPSATKFDCANGALDQLVLGRTQVSKLNRVWSDNYNSGWIVGLDAKTGKQFARFDSALVTLNGKPTGAQPSVESGGPYCDFATVGNCPGRVTTDTNGDVWIINRAFGQQGTLSKFSGSVSHCIDRNGNGVIETSNDANGNGVVEVNNPAEFFSQQDECMLTTIPVGPYNVWPRGVAVDKKGKIWASTFIDGKAYRYNAAEPVQLEATIDLNKAVGVGTNPYSMASGGDYMFLSNRGGAGTLRIHIDSLAVDNVAGCPPTYGIVADPGGNIAYLGGYGGDGVYKADFTNHTCTKFNTGSAGQTTAVTLDLDGNIWVSGYSSAQICKLTPAGVLLGCYPAFGGAPHGLSVDFFGTIWSVTDGSPFINAFDTSGNHLATIAGVTPSIDSPETPPSANPGRDFTPYLYSDFTGVQIDRQAPYTRVGSWDGTYDSTVPGLPWAQVVWNQEPQGAVPSDTSLVVSARAGDDPTSLGQASYQAVSSGGALAGLKGKLIQVKVDFNGPGYDTPILSDITVVGPCASPGETCCLTDGDCNAGGTVCTQNTCPTPGGVCTHAPKPGCCQTDADCNDGNSCTTDACPVPGGLCAHAPVAGCCNVNADCALGKTCQLDICSGPGGTCSHQAIKGCCQQDADCDTGNACLDFKCPMAGAACVITPKAGCCQQDSDCVTNDVCATAKCDVATKTCQKPVVAADCCKVDSDCDDPKDMCVVGVCPVSGGKCAHKTKANCCTAASPEVGKGCDAPVSPNDKAPCKAGVWACVMGMLQCQGAVHPKAEVCNGLDDNCDGQVDNVTGTDMSLCATGQACVGGACRVPCKGGEFPCDPGLSCDEKQHVCVVSECLMVTCPAGQECQAGGKCVVIGMMGTGGSGGGAGASGGGGHAGASGGAGGKGGSSAGGASVATGGHATGGASGAAAGGASGAMGGHATGGAMAAGGASAGGASAGAGANAAAVTDTSQKGGCGCELPGAPRPSGGPILGLLLGLGALVRRKTQKFGRVRP